MSFLREFRQFALRGNVVDLAVGVIIGAAFNKIVDAVVSDLVMPVVGRFTGGIAFVNYFVPLKPVPEGVPHTLEAVRKAGIPVLAWGDFVNVVLNFVILAFIVFVMVKQINRLHHETPKTPAPAEDTVLLREIRDALQKMSGGTGR